MPKTIYLGEDEWSERNSKIRAIRNRDIRLDACDDAEPTGDGR